MSKFTEEKLELAFIELLENQGITYVFGKDIQRNQSEVLLEDDLKEYLKSRYKTENIRESEIAGIVRKLQNYPASDLYDSNKSIMKLISDGFILKREKADDKDIYIEFNGQQHYYPIDMFGGMDAHLRTKENDLIKSEIVKNQGC